MFKDRFVLLYNIKYNKKISTNFVIYFIIIIVVLSNKIERYFLQKIRKIIVVKLIYIYTQIH